VTSSGNGHDRRRGSVAHAEQVTVGRRRFDLSRPTKVLFPDDGITKADVVTYYRDVAPVMLPHLRGRPLMLQRCPDGVAGGCFYQKKASGHFPDWVPTVDAPKAGGVVRHAVCNDEATLAYLAGQATLSFHVWLSRADRLERPDRVVFDFDPSRPDFASVRRGARAAGDLLEELGLEPFVATTGSRGLHVVAAIDRRAGFDEVRTFARRAADVLARHDAESLTTEARKERRGGRVLIDVLRNGYAQTTVAPYSLRPIPGAPVATPLEWRELDAPRLGPRSYGLANVRRRLDARGDPWDRLARSARPLGPARRRLAELGPAVPHAG
jgi:bifunctional non-homologous end joining protein LigD